MNSLWLELSTLGGYNCWLMLSLLGTLLGFNMLCCENGLDFLKSNGKWKEAIVPQGSYVSSTNLSFEKKLLCQPMKPGENTLKCCPDIYKINSEVICYIL